MQTARLFTALQLRDVTLKNRVIISPMWQYCGEYGHATDYHLMHYGQLAEGGAGLVIQEGTTVDKRGRGTPGDLGIWDDSFIPGLKRIVQLIKHNGSIPGIQLIHPGRKVMERVPWDGKEPLTAEEMKDLDPGQWDRVAPSVTPQSIAPNHPLPRAMTKADIRSSIDAFVSAASRADQAGYEVFELHAAHGYLIHLFLSEATNLRTDEYGGSFKNRIRFLQEIVEGVRGGIPQSKPLLVRLSCIDGSNWSIENTVALARILKSLGVDMIDCSMGGISRDVGMDRRSDYAYQAGLAATVRREAQIMTNAVGLIVHARHAEAIIAGGMADTVGIGREAIYNPHWPIDAAHKLGVDPEFSMLPKRQRFWLNYRNQGMDRFLPSTHSPGAIPEFIGDNAVDCPVNPSQVRGK